MNRVFRRGLWHSMSLACVMLVLLGGVQLAAQVLQISGHVVRSSDKQSLQATVVLYEISSNSNIGYNPVDKAMTDAQGQYVFNHGVKLNVLYTMVAYPMDQGYLTTYYPAAMDFATAQTFTLSNSRSDMDFIVGSPRTYDNSISGMVQDAQGKALDAQVFIQSANSINSQAYSVTTNKKNTGFFELKNLAPGTYILMAVPSDMGYASGYYRLNDLAANDPSLATVVKVSESGAVNPSPTIILGTAAQNTVDAVIKGMVVTQNKSAIAGAVIQVFDASGQEIRANTEVVSGKDGMFVWTQGALPGGTYLLHVRCQGFNDVELKVEIGTKNPNQFVTIMMSPDNTVNYDNALSGRVQDESGNPISCTVMAMPVLADGSIGVNLFMSKTHTSADGSFSLTNLRPGSYALYANDDNGAFAAGYYVVSANASANPMDATHVDVTETSKNSTPYVLTLSKAKQRSNYEFYASVVDDQQQPLEGVVFTAIDEKGNQVLVNQANTTDAYGMVRLLFPGVGSYVLTASKDGYVDAVGSISFSTSFWAQKALIVMQKKNSMNGSSKSQIVAGVSEEVDFVEALYPQPAQSEVHLRLQSGVLADEVLVYNISGTCVSHMSNLDAHTIVIPLQNLDAGSYIVQILRNGKMIGSRSFIKR